MTLIDIETSPNLHIHGWNKEGAGYSNLSQAKDFLVNNSVDCDVLTVNPKQDELPLDNFSSYTLSCPWVFTIQLKEYLIYIKNNSNYSSIVVFDCRKGKTLKN